ncbi:hypothetical protein EVAR_34145_1 [Eumeta japonica]|uniref:Uncharacterized protein n=1 Tax=Eumeta variegata TaxID=151549 RepID=A0A4C1ZZ41_EUMVA|nr:hypothetical protein EVAR_34145_1 [Eumeta japonica]
MRLGPTSDDRPRDKNHHHWKRCRSRLRKSTPLNKIPNDIESTNDIDNAIGRSVITTGVPLWKELPLPTELIGKWPKLLNRTATSPYPPLRTPTTLAFEDREKAECLANSIESNAHTPHMILTHTSRIEEEVRQKVSLDPKDDLDPVTLDEVKGLVKISKPGRLRASMV